MSVTFKFGTVDKDSPSLNVGDGRYPLAGHSPLAQPDSASVPYQVKFPMWFRQNQQQQVVREVARRFNDLALKFSAMDVPDSEVLWGSKTVLSQNPRAISLAADQDSALNQYNLDITWPASNERIVSRPLNPQAPVALASDNYKLKLHVDGREHDLSVGVSQNYGQVDNNHDVLKRLAIAINSQQPAVKATVEETVNPSDPTAPYRIPGRSVKMTIQGQAQDFYLEDVQGALAANFGVDRNQPGGAAYVRVDNIRATSHGNVVNINDLVGVVHDSGQFKVRVAQGPRPLLDSVQQFLFSYNELVDYVTQNSDYLRPSLHDRLVRPQRERAESLSEVGLNVDQQGHVTPNRNFIQNMLGNYKTTSLRLLKGEYAWGTAVMEQINTIQQVGLEHYANPLLQQSEEQVRSRAWLALDSLREKIISAYY